MIYLKKTASPEEFLVFSDWCYNTGCLCKELREQCDDGNLDQGDGCDGQCHVESGFICVGGDRNQPDRLETAGFSGVVRDRKEVQETTLVACN